MTTPDPRELLHRQIDHLPAEVVEQIADFTLFLIKRHRLEAPYSEWSGDEWQAFALEQFFRDEGEGEEVSYSLDDAQEIFRR